YSTVLREDYFYAERLLDDAAAFFLSPLMVISYKAVGYVGLALFYAPLRMILESTRRQTEIRNAQRQLIHRDRMAAKGEMAAEIAHELRNLLAIISARAQMLVRDAGRKVFDNVPRHAEIVLEQAGHMEALASGLVEFSRAELSVERVNLNTLLARSVEFVRSQSRFDGVEWDLKLGDPLPELMADPGQLHQVFLNLFLNAADAMKDADSPRRVVRVAGSFDERGRVIRIDVSDTGPGIPPEVRARIFEPRLTSKSFWRSFGALHTQR